MTPFSITFITAMLKIQGKLCLLFPRWNGHARQYKQTVILVVEGQGTWWGGGGGSLNFLYPLLPAPAPCVSGYPSYYLYAFSTAK